MNRLEWSNLAFSTVLFSIIIWCLSLGGVVGTIAIVILILFLITATITVLRSMFWPTSAGMQIAIVIKDGKKEPDPSRWDEYLAVFESRTSGISLWIAMVWQLVLLSGLIYYVPRYISVPYAVILMCAEIAKWRVYTTIKKNRVAWGAAEYIRLAQSFVNEIEKK